MVEKYLSETDIKKLLQCSRCKRVPAAPPIYMCKIGHHECSICFTRSNVCGNDETDPSTDTESESGSFRKEEYSVGVIYPKNFRRNVKHTCSICNEEVMKTRNLFAECLLIHLDGRKDDRELYLPEIKNNDPTQNYADCCYNIYGPPCPRFDPQTISVPNLEPQNYPRYHAVPQFNYTPAPYVLNEPEIDFPQDPNFYFPDYGSGGLYSDNSSRKELSGRKSKCNFPSQGSVLSLNGESSRRPIRCPTHLCGRNIAVTALTSHFCFDHTDVPPVDIDLDVNSHLFVDPQTIPFNYARCVAILLISTNSDAVHSVSHQNVLSTTKMRNSLPLIVMASKLECTPKLNHGSIPGIKEEDSQSDTLNRGDFEDHGGTKTPLLVLWIAGLETNSSLYTTIQVSEKESNVRSMVYTGPITSLRESQSTSKIFEQGDCLVIHPGMLESIIGERGGFDLHVMIH